MEISVQTWILAPVSIHQSLDWHTENIVGSELLYLDPLGSPIVTLADFCPCWFFFPLQFLHFLAKCPVSPQMNHTTSSMFIFFFLNWVVWLAFCLFFSSLLHHVGTGLPFGCSWWSILCMSLLFNIKTNQQILNEDFLSFMFQSCGEVPPCRRQLGNNATCHKLIRQDVSELFEFPHNKLELMSLFHGRTVINHSEIMVMLHHI